MKFPLVVYGLAFVGLATTSNANVFPRKLKQSKGTKSCKKSKSSKRSKSAKNPSFIGSHVGIDIEDGTIQNLYIYCENGVCDIELRDVRFTTCTLITGNEYLGGVAVAAGVPEDSLDDFDLDLYCLQDGRTTIDIGSNTPETTLKGDLIRLEGGGIRRTGTSFIYFNEYLGNLSADKPPTPHSGLYTGVDPEDGSGQSLQILCMEGFCDVTLGDTSFSTCSAITGDLFFGGVAIARGIPEDSLDDFSLNLYCLAKGKNQFDSTPTGTLTGNLLGLQDGIIRRTGPGFTYFKKSSKPESMMNQVSTGQYLNAADTKGGTVQSFDILCADGKCDVTYGESSFIICEDITGYSFLGGVAVAKGIDQHSLDNFSLDLYCSTLEKPILEIDIDLDDPVTTISAGLVLLEDGIIRNVNSGETFFNLYSGNASTDEDPSGCISNGFYNGIFLDSGYPGTRSIYCGKEVCEIASNAIGYTDCIVPTGRFIYNGVAFVKGVPKESLDDFDIDLYCLKKDEQVEYGVTISATTINGDMDAVQSNDVIKAFDPAEVTYYKSTAQ